MSRVPVVEMKTRARALARLREVTGASACAYAGAGRRERGGSGPAGAAWFLFDVLPVCRIETPCDKQE